ncbi:MAG TPA: YggS family pyridoxal phosphate-dependent enzyme [Actinomycetes bacterium]|nr:YggS family pyridoxal phosphate-dependent enzyme [Actinomycetes bacterium]
MSAQESRRDELAANLAAVRRRIDAACARAGRDPAAITLVVVTKNWPASDVRALAGLGVRDVGENRDQEAAAKHDACADLDQLVWHFVGQLQTNKARSVARYADVVHSVDRARLVAALDRAAEAEGRRLTCLVQVDLDGGVGRGGARPDTVLDLAETVASSRQLALGGLMAVAPLGTDPAPAFARLGELAVTVREHHPQATIVSAGMSGDLEAAVAAGATHLRIGTAVLGSRRAVR